MLCLHLYVGSQAHLFVGGNQRSISGVLNKVFAALSGLELTDHGMDWLTGSPWNLPDFVSQHSCAVPYFTLYVGATDLSSGLLCEQKIFYPLRNLPISYLFFNIGFLA